MAPGEHETPGRRPGTDDADHESGAVVVSLDQPAALAGLEGQGAVAPVAKLEKRVGLPPLVDLGGEAGEGLGRLAGHPYGHENPGPVSAHSARGRSR